MKYSFLLASGNQHKAQEFAVLFDPSIIAINSAPEKLEVIEDADTFNENAFKKAEAYYKKYNLPVMSDDSGLIIDKLPGELGVHTARFGGDDLTAKERNLLLLERMSEFSGIDRNAHFICVLCFYLNENEVYFFEGRVDGVIARSIRAEKGGFGYDPIFCPSKLETGESLAECSEWKQKNGHRALSCQAAQKFFKERIGQN